MALIKTSSIVSQVSGSIGGVTYARNRYGAIARNRSGVINPSTPRQLNAREIVRQVVEAWTSALTAAQRTAWSTYASAINLVNRLGESMHVTGFNAFVATNAALVNAGVSIIEDGPTSLIAPGADPTFAPTYDESSANVSIVFDNTAAWATEAGGYMLIYQGLPQPATRNFFKGNYRYVGKIAGGVVPPTSPTVFTPLPFTAIEGQRIWTQYRIVRADGSMSPRITVAPADVVA